MDGGGHCYQMLPDGVLLQSKSSNNSLLFLVKVFSITDQLINGGKYLVSGVP